MNKSSINLLIKTCFIQSGCHLSEWTQRDQSKHSLSIWNPVSAVIIRIHKFKHQSSNKNRRNSSSFSLHYLINVDFDTHNTKYKVTSSFNISFINNYKAEVYDQMYLVKVVSFWELIEKKNSPRNFWFNFNVKSTEFFEIVLIIDRNLHDVKLIYIWLNRSIPGRDQCNEYSCDGVKLPKSHS